MTLTMVRPDHTGIQPVYLSPAEQATSLAMTLAQYGFSTEVLTTKAYQQHPCVVVTGSYVRHVPHPEYIYAAPDDDGTWWFWRPTSADPLEMEVVAPLSEVSVTADYFTRTFSLVVTSAPVTGLAS